MKRVSSFNELVGLIEIGVDLSIQSAVMGEYDPVEINMPLNEVIKLIKEGKIYYKEF